MPDGEKDLTLANLDARLQEVEALQALILKILSTTKPLDPVLEQYGATETQAQAFYRLLDDLAARARGQDEDNRPSFGYFELQVNEIFPQLRRNREFVQVILDTLKLERPAYRELHAYTAAQGWPTWR
jgi:hypothetical protein